MPALVVPGWLTNEIVATAAGLMTKDVDVTFNPAPLAVIV